VSTLLRYPRIDGARLASAKLEGGFYMRLFIPPSLVAAGWDDEDVYTAFWTRNVTYRTAMVDYAYDAFPTTEDAIVPDDSHASVSVGDQVQTYFNLSNFPSQYTVLTEKYAQLPDRLRNFKTMAAQRDYMTFFLQNMMETRFGPASGSYSCPGCHRLMTKELPSRGMAGWFYDQMFWPSIPLVGILDTNAGFVFGGNQLAGGLQIVQTRYDTKTCAAPTLGYPTCIDQSTVSKEPFVMRMYHGMNHRNTSADLISMHKMENKGSGVCEKRTAQENYAYDQENAVRNDVVFTLLNARAAMNDTTRFDPIAQARYTWPYFWDQIAAYQKFETDQDDHTHLYGPVSTWACSFVLPLTMMAGMCETFYETKVGTQTHKHTSCVNFHACIYTRNINA
jgi:hypothetical protein